MQQDLLSLNRTPTVEELREHFITHDFTTLPTEDYSEQSSRRNELHAHIVSLINDKWKKNAKSMKHKTPQSCYTKNHPIEALRIRVQNLIADKVIMLLDEPERAKKFLKAFMKPHEIELFFKQINNPELSFNESDLIEIIINEASDESDTHDKADKLVDNAVNTMMKVMDYERLYKIAKINSCHDDFNTFRPENFEAITHHRRWNHTRTKYNAPLSYVRIKEQEIVVSMEDAADAEAKVENFYRILSENDRNILRLSIKGYNQSEIADILNYETQGAISKRLAKIKEKWNEFSLESA